MGQFESIANKMVSYRSKTSWLSIEKYYNVLANNNDGSLSMAFVLLAINNEKGTTVTSIAPRIGMEPNSLSRILKKLIEKKFVFKKKSKTDKRKVYICLTKLGIEKQTLAIEKLHVLEKNINEIVTKEQLKSYFIVNDAIVSAISKLKT